MTHLTLSPRRSFALLATTLGALTAGCFASEEEANSEGVADLMPEVPPGMPGDPANPDNGQTPAGPGAGGPGGGDTPVNPGGPADPGGMPGPGAGGAGNPPPAGGGAGSDMPGGGAGPAAGGDGPDGPPPVGFMCEDMDVDCVDGKAGDFECSGVDLLAHLSGPEMQGGTGNDIWGWTDPRDGKEYVLMGLTNGTAFVDISNPCMPVHLGHLKTETVNQIWRDIKVYKDHAYIVSESQGHGMQVFDLKKLRDVQNPPQVFTADFVDKTIASTHNIVMNEESGFAYTVLSNNCTSGTSFDLSNPLAPKSMGCWGDSGRIHDAQCINYKGPDAAFAGKEICLSGNEGAGVAIYDVTDKAAVQRIGATQYMNVSYGHQGWVTDDHKYFLFGDEGDEIAKKINTTIYIFDLADLTNPTLKGTYVSDLPATDHNLYVRGNYAFLASYAAGVRILDLTMIDQGTITEAGFFDTFPAHNNAGFSDMWSNYPYFKSGVLVTSGGEGLFILHPEAKFMR